MNITSCMYFDYTIIFCYVLNFLIYAWYTKTLLVSFSSNIKHNIIHLIFISLTLIFSTYYYSEIVFHELLNFSFNYVTITIAMFTISYVGLIYQKMKIIYTR